MLNGTSASFDIQFNLTDFEHGSKNVTLAFDLVPLDDLSINLPPGEKYRHITSNRYGQQGDLKNKPVLERGNLSVRFFPNPVVLTLSNPAKRVTATLIARSNASTGLYAINSMMIDPTLPSMDVSSPSYSFLKITNVKTELASESSWKGLNQVALYIVLAAIVIVFAVILLRNLLYRNSENRPISQNNAQNTKQLEKKGW